MHGDTGETDMDSQDLERHMEAKTVLMADLHAKVIENHTTLHFTLCT